MTLCTHWKSPRLWLRILAAAASNFLIGLIWYSKWLFFEQWHDLMGLTSLDNFPFYILFIRDFTLMLFMGLLMHVLLCAQQAYGWKKGAGVGFIIALFCVLAMEMNYLYWADHFKLWAINAGYHLLSITAMGAIVATLKRNPTKTA